MDVLPEAAHRALAYISLVNRGGAQPSRKSVEEFFRAATPREPESLSGLLAVLQRRQRMFGEAETGIEYLERMEWVADVGAGVALTPVGEALVRALDDAELEDEIVEAVLDVDDPFAYAKAIAYLRTEAPALLVDPYLRMAQLIELDRVPTVERVLVSTKLKAEDRADLGRVAQIVGAKRSMDVRASGELHDRYLIPSSGSVVMLGGSLNTIGRSPITLTTLSAYLSDVVRVRYEAMWSEAVSVAPPSLSTD